MVPRTSYPPTHLHSHLTATLSPSAAQAHLAVFLKQSERKPHLHPDSQLSRRGVDYSAHSGPSGGLAIHHLKRIEAGLRGENLVKETAEELARFNSGTTDVDGELLPEGDDRKLDSLISQTEKRKEGEKGTKKRKRTQEEIEEWAESSSHAGCAPEEQELESFVNTPLHISSDWQDQEEYEQEQEPWYGDVGGEEREGAPVVKQNGAPPGIVKDEEDGKVQKPRTEAEKRAKKEAKKARRLEMKREKAKAGKG